MFLEDQPAADDAVLEADVQEATPEPLSAEAGIDAEDTSFLYGDAGDSQAMETSGHE